VFLGLFPDQTKAFVAAFPFRQYGVRNLDVWVIDRRRYGQLYDTLNSPAVVPAALQGRVYSSYEGSRETASRYCHRWRCRYPGCHLAGLFRPRGSKRRRSSYVAKRTSGAGKPSFYHSKPAPEPNAAEAAEMKAPSFDVVRIDPEGNTVIAGKAEPGAEVTILDADKPIGALTANENGEWVFLPDAPLPSGSRELSLLARNKKGQEKPSDDVVVLVVPEQSGDTPLAVKTNRDGGESQILQGGARSGDQAPVVISAVDYLEDGSLTIKGEAKPGSVVQLYIDNQALGRATADKNGRWVIDPKDKVTNGPLTLRADMLASDGTVIARAERPFERTAIPTIPEGTRVVVQPGNSLWLLARHAYGDGKAYTVIYDANKRQIVDPGLIYPGQVFIIPNN
jgi:hypothetical protein